MNRYFILNNVQVFTVTFNHFNAFFLTPTKLHISLKQIAGTKI